LFEHRKNRKESSRPNHLRYNCPHGNLLISHLQIQSKDENIQNLSIYLMRKVLRSSIVSEKMDDIIENLFTLLDAKEDGASKATIVLIADYIVQNPTQTLPILFKRVDNQVKRKNALHVLSEVFKMKNEIKENSELKFDCFEINLKHVDFRRIIAPDTR
jgi:hypothetical protein